MPTKPTSDRTPTAGGPPTHLTPGTVGGALRPPKQTKRTQSPLLLSPIMRNEPNLPSRQLHTATVFAKRTQFRPPTVPAPTQLCETNPISTYKLSSRPLFQRNEPNLPHHRQSTIYNIQSPGPICTAADLWKTKNAKRTQFAATNIQSTIHPARRNKIKIRIQGLF